MAIKLLNLRFKHGFHHFIEFVLIFIVFHLYNYVSYVINCLDTCILNYHLIWIFLLIVTLIWKLTIIVEVCRLVYLLITYYSLSAPPPLHQTFKNYFDLNTTWFKILGWQLPNTDQSYRQNQQILKYRIKTL